MSCSRGRNSKAVSGAVAALKNVTVDEGRKIFHRLAKDRLKDLKVEFGIANGRKPNQEECGHLTEQAHAHGRQHIAREATAAQERHGTDTAGTEGRRAPAGGAGARKGEMNGSARAVYMQAGGDAARRLHAAENPALR